MKPVKNRVHCPDSGRIKMLFETEKKAETFMKFNAATILEEEGYAPVRSYECISCGGWHVTSRQKAASKTSMTERILNQYETDRQQDLQRKQERTQYIEQQTEKLKLLLEQLEEKIVLLNTLETKTLNFELNLQEAQILLNSIKEIRFHFKGSIPRIRFAEKRLKEF